MSFFIPSFGGQGGGGGQNPDTAFTGVTIVGNIITFHRQNGQTHPVDLSQIIPDATNESIKNIRVDGKNLVLTKVDNSETMVDLTQLLSASNISFNSANTGLTSTDVQGAIVEVDNKTITAGALVGTNLELEKVDGSKVNIDVTRLVGINTINTETPDTQGNIDLALEINVDNLEFKIKDNAENTLELYTDVDANTLIQYFV